METRLQRRKYIAARNWASMNTDILCSIFTRLPYVDLLQVNSTCWGWNAAVNLFKSCSLPSSIQEMPWLIFTPHEDVEGEETGRFMNIEGEKIYPFNNLAAKKMNDGGSCCCIGSSHDWLVFLDKQAIPYLLNPFASHRIDLPHFDLSLGVEKVYGIGNKCIIKTVDQNLNRLPRGIFVRKAVLSSSPSLDNKYYYLVMIYGVADSLAFCKDGDTSWSKLDDEHYNDVIFHENQLYGFCSRHYLHYSHLIVWDMNQDGFHLVKKIDIMNEEISTALHDRGDSVEQFYLVESKGDLLVVRRVSKICSTYEGHINSCEIEFKIFKLDMEQKLWRGIDSLGGFALFLGTGVNQSISVKIRNCKILKQDSIYFTVNALHLSGVFSLKDNCVDWTDWFCGIKRESRGSPPTWVVPLVK